MGRKRKPEMAKEYVFVMYQFILEDTGRAFLLIVDTDDETGYRAKGTRCGKRVWVPRSLVNEPEKYSDGMAEGEMEIEKWFAEKNRMA